MAAAIQPAAQPAAEVLAAPADTGAWGPVLDWGQQAKHMAMLSTGKVLVWSTGDNARVWNPTDGTFKLTPFTFGDLHCAGQSTLADGRVVVVGGQDGGTHNGTNITALFDPATETWTNGQPMTDLRWYATSTTLADGKVLATSGDAPDGTRSQIPELYDPATNTWVRLTGAQRDQGLYPFMFVLPNGLVYDAGPKTNTALLNPAGTGSWTPGPTALYSTNGYAESAVQYLPGKILRAGGGDPAIKTAMVVDMNVANPSWRAIDPMAFARRRMNLTILADGTVMALGGTGSGDSEAAAVLAGEIWDPVTEDWTTVEAMAEARMYHSSAIMLADGRVVIGGGEAGGRLRAQIYSPPYLFKGARPTISSSPASAAYGTTLAITSPDAAAITSVALLRPSAATHALDMNQKYVPLNFSRSGNTLNAIGPATGGVAPPGDYMLIVKNAAGVPSVARWVRIGTAGGLQPGTVAGRVTDVVTGDPIQGATVASSAGTDTTDSQGRYSIGGVPAGELQLTFSFGGYATETRNALVSGGQTTTLNVALAPPGGVAGRVTDASTGDPLVGATITYPGGVTITDTLGDYQINGVPAGSLALSFSALGYASSTRTVNVPAGGVATQDVGLTPSATYVAGEVRDVATDALLVGATVSISTGQTTTTDALGRYHVDLPPGDYTVTATAVGYDPSSGPVLINGGSYATLDFALVATVQPTTAPPTTAPPTTPPPTTPPPTAPPATLSFVPGRRFAREVQQRDQELRDRGADPPSPGHEPDRHVLQHVPAVHRQRHRRTDGHGREAADLLDRRRPEWWVALQDGIHVDRDGRDLGERPRPHRTGAQDDGERREQRVGRVRAARRHRHRRRHRRVHPRRWQLEQRLLHEPRGDQQAGTRPRCRRHANDPAADHCSAHDCSADDGASHHGASHHGSADDRTAHDRPADHGAPDHGSADDRTAHDRPADHGTSDHSAADDSAAHAPDRRDPDQGHHLRGRAAEPDQRRRQPHGHGHARDRVRDRRDVLGTAGAEHRVHAGELHRDGRPVRHVPHAGHHAADGLTADVHALERRHDQRQPPADRDGPVAPASRWDRHRCRLRAARARDDLCHRRAPEAGHGDERSPGGVRRG